LSWCWIGVYLLAFTAAATKLPNYILPVLPPCALLIARYLDRWRRGELTIPAWVQWAGLSVLALIGVGATAGLLVAGGVVEVRWLRGRSWPGLETWAAVGLLPLAGGLAAAVCLWHRQRSAFVSVLALTAWCFVLPLAAGGSMALDAFRAPRPLVQQVGALQRDQEIRIGCYQLEFLPSLNFCVQRPVQHYDSAEDALELLAQPLEAYLFLPRSDWEQLASRAPPSARVLGIHREMYRAGEVVVVTNR